MVNIFWSVEENISATHTTIILMIQWIFGAVYRGNQNYTIQALAHLEPVSWKVAAVCTGDISSLGGNKFLSSAETLFISNEYNIVKPQLLDAACANSIKNKLPS